MVGMDVKLTVVSLAPDDAREQQEAARLLATELWRGGVGAVQVTAPGVKAAAGGQLAVSGVFSAATVTAISEVAVAFVSRHAAQRVTLTAGDVEVDIDGELDEVQRDALAAVVATFGERSAGGW